MISIAVISPDSNFQQLYKILLKSEALPSYSAKTQETGLTIIKNYQPNIVVIDSNMDNESYEIIEKIRTNKDIDKKTHIIYLISSEDTDSIEKTKLKIDNVFSKNTTTPKEVLEKIKDLI